MLRARAARQDVLVTFTARRGCYLPNGRYSKAKVCRAPSASAYRNAFGMFDAKFPWVKTYSAWNEVNHKSQPTFKSPRTAAGYYNVLRAQARRGRFRVMAADMLDTGNMRRYLATFRRYAKGSPKLWGLHNYGDVNRRRTTYTKQMLRTVPGEVWLTETGGIVKLLPSFKPSPRRVPPHAPRTCSGSRAPTTRAAAACARRSPACSCTRSTAPAAAPASTPAW